MSWIRRDCPVWGTMDHRGDGADRGLPDLLARRWEWPRGLWADLERKTEKGRLSPKQHDLADERAILICRSIEEAERVLMERQEEVER